MTSDKGTLNYREYQLSKVRSLGSMSIQIKASGGEVQTFNLGIDRDEFNAIQDILLHEYKHKSLEEMQPYELFMTLQTWSLETLREWLKSYDKHGEYDDDIENGFVLTREHAINNVFNLLVIDNQ